MTTLTYFCSECHGYTTEDRVDGKNPVCEHCQTEDVVMVRKDDIPSDIQASFYDDNFGHWDNMNDPDMREFYVDTQRKSVSKKCDGCGRTVKILPDYAYCDSCATKREMGYDLDW